MAGLRVTRYKSVEKITIGAVGGTRTRRQRDHFRKIMRKEVLDFGSDLAVGEVKAQAQRTRTVPSSMVLDGRTIVPLTRNQGLRIARMNPEVDTITGFDRRIQFFYTDFALLFRAVTFAYSRLGALMRRDSGDAWESVYFWCDQPLEKKGQGKKFKSLAQVETWLSKATDPMTRVSIIGPTVEYRRFVIYNRRGSKQPAQYVPVKDATNEGLARDRYTFSRARTKDGPIVKARVNKRTGRTRVRAQVAKAIGFIVRDALRRQYRDLYTTYRFIPVPVSELPLPVKGHNNSNWKPSEENKHVPMISLGLRKKPRGRQRFGTLH